MAGDWIKVRDALHEDPAVGRIATALGVDVYGAIGRLIRVWAWADQQVEDGNADVTHVYLDQLVNTPGMADAMVLVGWLEVPEAGRIRFPKYDRHMSKSAKKRALTNRRVQLHRSNAPETNLKRKSVTREEKSSTYKHPPVTNRKADTEHPVQGGLTTSTPASPPTPEAPRNHVTLKPPAAMTPEERERANIAPPPPGLMERWKKPVDHYAGIRARGPRRQREPGEDEDELHESADETPTAAPPKPTQASAAPLPTEWENTPEGVDHAASLLGMKRLPSEQDQDLAQRIHQRIALG